MKEEKTVLQSRLNLDSDMILWLFSKNLDVFAEITLKVDLVSPLWIVLQIVGIIT